MPHPMDNLVRSYEFTPQEARSVWNTLSDDERHAWAWFAATASERVAILEGLSDEAREPFIRQATLHPNEQLHTPLYLTYVRAMSKAGVHTRDRFLARESERMAA